MWPYWLHQKKCAWKRDQTINVNVRDATEARVRSEWSQNKKKIGNISKEMRAQHTHSCKKLSSQYLLPVCRVPEWPACSERKTSVSGCLTVGKDLKTIKPGNLNILGKKISSVHMTTAFLIKSVLFNYQGIDHLLCKNFKDFLSTKVGSLSANWCRSDRIRIHRGSVGDPDPHVFGPSGSGYISHRWE